ncbi:ABC transporter substrate-binding protein [Pseudonocardia sp. ICBG1034]|uniref:ABC transporter substrate-binding protein n=1 Tax=Pseudonocardia sp. ICBG1034 TaxID=2844381 RepID=UPI001CCBCF8A|nr:ABC transporter substrate-binding protein [Pseudonocardia sp. ICBG1034]
MATDLLLPIDDDLNRRAFVAGSAAFLGLLAAGCGPASPAPVDGGVGHRSVAHAFGTTEITGVPGRVVTLGWGPAEAALAVGVVPVAVPQGRDNGGDESGLHPWTAEHLRTHDLTRPAVLSSGAADDPAPEEIAALRPDLILATEAGLTTQQYAVLSRIAPTVAHPGEAWATPWRDVIRISGHALGRPAESERVLTALDERTRAAALAHPEFVGLTITAATTYEGALIVYTASEPRAQLLAQLGFVVDSYGATANELDMSFEEAGRIDSDVVLMYHATEAERREFEAGPVPELVPQFGRGQVASVVGAANVAAVSPPTALSWPWTIDSFTAALSTAAMAARGR